MAGTQTAAAARTDSCSSRAETGAEQHDEEEEEGGKKGREGRNRWLKVVVVLIQGEEDEDRG